jgi:hypothetical protein
VDSITVAALGNLETLGVTAILDKGRGMRPIIVKIFEILNIPTNIKVG